jgi:ribonuclease P protein component
MFPLLKEGTKTFKNNLFLLRLVLRSKDSRFCFSVSKKVAKNAVVRNRLRRAGYRVLEQYLPRLTSKVLAVFSFREIPRNNEDIGTSVESILKESHLIK